MEREKTVVDLAITSDTHFSKSNPVEAPISIYEFGQEFCQIDPRPDLIIHAGDITGDGSIEIALKLAKELTGCQSEILAIPGNRDLKNGSQKDFRKNLQSTNRIRLLDEEPYILHKDGERVLVIGLMGISGGFGTSVVGCSRNDPQYEISAGDELNKARKFVDRIDDIDALIVVSHYPLLVRGKDERSDYPTDEPSQLAEMFLELPVKTKLFIHGHFHSYKTSHKIGNFNNINGALALRSKNKFTRHALEIGQ